MMVAKITAKVGAQQKRLLTFHVDFLQNILQSPPLISVHVIVCQIKGECVCRLVSKFSDFVKQVNKFLFHFFGLKFPAAGG